MIKPAAALSSAPIVVILGLSTIKYHDFAFKGTLGNFPLYFAGEALIFIGLGLFIAPLFDERSTKSQKLISGLGIALVVGCIAYKYINAL